MKNPYKRLMRGKNIGGWESQDGCRPIRDREHGLAGQDIWLRMKKLGFVHGDWFMDPLTEWESRLKSWLIWGYWEKD